MFKVFEKPRTSDFMRYPRSLQDAFRGVDYGCAIEVPTSTGKWLKTLLNGFQKVVWVSAVVVIFVILMNLV